MTAQEANERAQAIYGEHDDAEEMLEQLGLDFAELWPLANRRAWWTMGRISEQDGEVLPALASLFLYGVVVGLLYERGRYSESPEATDYP